LEESEDVLTRDIFTITIVKIIAGKKETCGGVKNATTWLPCELKLFNSVELSSMGQSDGYLIIIQFTGFEYVI
jgi:hypothetical protein